MTVTGRLVPLSLFVMLNACVTVRSNTSPGADLGRYRTFAFFRSPQAGPKQTAFEHSPAGQVVEQHIAAGLLGRGMTENMQNPDLLVAYHSKLELELLNAKDWGYSGYHWGEWGGGPGFTANTYTQGTLFVDLIDARTHNVVWRGTASAVADHPDNPDEQKLGAAVDKVMSKLPAMVASTARPAM
jgi:hypothetical protein